MFQIAKLHIISLNVNACLLYFCSSDINAYFYGILDYRENYTYKKMGHFVCKTILAATILIFGCMPAYAFQHDDDVEIAIKGIVEKYSNTEGVECMTIVKGKGLELLKSCEKPFKSVVLQPGAGSDEIRAYLTEQQIPFIDGCLLVGLATFPRET